MNRRHFIATSVVGTAALVGGGWYAYHAYRDYAHHQELQQRRLQLRHQLVSEVTPVLTAKDHDELNQLPRTAMESIRLWFHPLCFNSAEFANEICTNSFLERFRTCSSTELQQALFTTTFTAKVASAEEIVTRVHLIAEDVGSTLNSNWASGCNEIARRWNVRLSAQNFALAEDFFVSVDAKVRDRLDQRCSSQDRGEMPSISSTAANLGASALLALRLARNPVAAIPVFLLLAVGPMINFIGSRVASPAAQLRHDIAGRMAVMANAIAAEFQTEVRQRIADLHALQQQAIDQAADQHSCSCVGLV